jgi:uncharacterized protein (DUF1800 family)
MASREELAHLLRRATFGPRAEEVDAAERTGPAATVDALLTFAGSGAAADAGAARTPPPAPPDPVAALGRNPGREQRIAAQKQQREQVGALMLWWLDRMVAADHQAHEKLTFFWHGHWATSVQKVKFPLVMLGQQQTLHTLGTGDFGALVHAMVRDPALIYWLDGHKNTARAPNENLARELMELFTLGIGNYTEGDVKAGARALTGWAVDRARNVSMVNEKRRDTGEKTILGRTGTFGAAEFVDILLDQGASARFVTARLWYRYASSDPVPADTHDRLIAAYGPTRDVARALRAVLTDPAFAATRGHLVKQPVEWAVGAMRQLGVRPGELPAKEQQLLVRALREQGQVPLDPPSVGGWPAGTAWLTTAGTQWRLRAADLLAAKASPAVLDKLAAAPANRRTDVLARLLAVDTFTDRTRTVLAGVAGQQRRMIALALASPEYTVH